ncbi:kinetochore-associated protein DSN1 homolog isoform X2 [Varanus komodoensis]|uniref:kinetochore-associated protein DSN1 homolog isoform X2 n=1 Tax=Varanus komodoensis TaxID=61221 RepID=UPI001CF7996C|nr:kinetochore-associated protein DSN1 homolog isoform X2 [Varanus komodoensis]
MEVDEVQHCPGSAEDLPRKLAQQEPSQGNQLGLEDGKNTEMFGTGKKECQLGPNLKDECALDSLSLKKASLQNLGAETDHALTSFSVSFGQLPSPRIARRSLYRYSQKLDSNRRKSLPPLQMDISELSKAISLDLPEADRMTALLLSSFRYCAQKLEHSLRQTEGFNPETFEQNVNLLLEELKLYTEKLRLDGSLQKCFEDPKGCLSDPALNASMAAFKEIMARFSAEKQAWEELLHSYQQNVEEIARQLDLCRLKQMPEEPVSYPGSSQANVLQTKPDYKKILDRQGEVFFFMECVLDEFHQMEKVCQSYMEEVTQYLQKQSAQLASRTFQRLEKSPARKLLRPLQTKSSVPPPPEG